MNELKTNQLCKPILLMSFQNNTDTIGLKYIHSLLKKNNIGSQVLFVPNYTSNDFNSIADYIGSLNPIIIGISVMSCEFYLVKEFTGLIKKKFPSIIVLWGGIHTAIDTPTCVMCADYVFRGECELAFLEFIQAILNNNPVKNILNLAYAENGILHCNNLRPYNTQLDLLPAPEHYIKESYIVDNNTVTKMNDNLFKKYTRYSGKFYSLTTTRGCPFSCTYCCNSAYSKLYGISKVRTRTVNNVINEMRQAVKLFPNISYINIQDDNFLTYDVKWLKRFAIVCRKEIKKQIVCRSTPIHLTKEKIKILKHAGIAWIFMGLQSGSTRVNKEIYHRYVSNETFIHATKLVKEYNLAGYYDVILDNPYETEEDLIQTINVILQIPKPYMLQILSLCFYQGTELYDRAVSDKLKFEDPLSKNFMKYKPIYLNKIIRVCPLLSKTIIMWLVNNRTTLLAKLILKIIYLPCILIIEPWVWLKLILISFNYDVFKTANMILHFFKTGFKRMILRK